MGGGVPKEATIINNTGTVGTSGAIPDLCSGNGETRRTIRIREIIPTLKQSINRICSFS
jgi:hypothetical protein